MPENLAITVNGNTPATMPEMVVVNGSVIAEWPGRDDSACRMTLERNRPEAIDIKIEFSDRAATEGRWRCVLSQSTAKLRKSNRENSDKTGQLWHKDGSHHRYSRPNLEH